MPRNADHNPDMLRYITLLEQRVANLERSIRGSALTITDRFGNIIVTSSSDHQGLSRPYIPWSIDLTDNMNIAPQVVTSSSFVSVWTISGWHQHPNLEVKVLVQNDAGTACEIQMFRSVVLDATAVDLGATMTVTLNGPLFIPEYDQFTTVEILVRRSAGVGNVRTNVIYAQGVG